MEYVQAATEVGGGIAAAGATAAATLYDYNRTNFMNDRKARLETEYTIMEMRLKQADLWREDIEEICSMTVEKMDKYLTVVAVELGLIVMTFCEGTLDPGAPTWLMGAHTLAIAGAFTFLLMSVWFGMHATVAAKSYEVKLLTQFVRLPVPTWSQLEGARTYGSSFEKTEPRQMFRVPFIMGSQESVLRRSAMAGAPSGGAAALLTSAQAPPSGAGATQAAAIPGGISNDPWGLERPGDKIYELDGKVRHEPFNLRHFKLLQEALKYWQSYDAFARVAMNIGNNQLLFILCYYVCDYVIMTRHSPTAGCLTDALFVCAIIAIIRLDMSLTTNEFRLALLLVITGPVCLCICACRWEKLWPWLATFWPWHNSPRFSFNLVRVLVPIAYLAHGCWMFFLLYIGKYIEQYRMGRHKVVFPYGFQAVVYTDVFAWLRSKKQSKSQASYLPTGAPLPAPARPDGNGPGVQAVRYEHGQAVPLRVDDQAGAAQRPVCKDPQREFDPLSFAPDLQSDREGAHEKRLVQLKEENDYGNVPCKIFFGAVALLGSLWLICGGLITMEMMDDNYFVVSPLVAMKPTPAASNNDPAAIPAEDKTYQILEGAHEIPTNWPHARIRAEGLACDYANRRVLASTRYGLYAADVGGNSSIGAISFHAASLPSDIRGKPVQDVAMDCTSGACDASILYEGNLISSCDVSSPRSAVSELQSNATSPRLPAASISDDWFSAQADQGPLESMLALATSSRCAGGAGSCTLVGTSSNRILDMQWSGEFNSAGGPELFPKKLLWTMASDDPELSSGSLHVINERYLGVLLSRSQRLEVLDLADDGLSAGSWKLPAREQWTAMCAMGDELYFLGHHASPQLWHVPVPDQFRTKVHRQTVAAAKDAQPKSSKRLRASRRHQ